MSRISVPTRKLRLFWIPSVPPAMTVNVPPAAISIPIACFWVRVSFSMYAETVVIKMGASRQTRIAAIEAFASCMPEI